MFSPDPNIESGRATETGPCALRGLRREEVRGWAMEAGFAEAGLVALPYDEQARDAERFEEWVAAGRAGTMKYLERRDEDGRLVRSSVGIPFQWARSAVVCFAGYHSAQPRSTELPRRARGGSRGTHGRAAWMRAARMRTECAGRATITRCC